MPFNRFSDIEFLDLDILWVTIPGIILLLFNNNNINNNNNNIKI